MSHDQDNYLLFEKHPIPMWVYDRATHRFLKVNEAAMRQYGYTNEEFLGMTIDEIRPPSQRHLLQETFTLADDEAYRQMGVWTHRRKDGSTFDVEIISVASMFNGHRARTVIAQERSARRDRAQQETSESYFHFLADHAPMMIWMSGPDAGIEWKNRPWLDFTGSTLDQEAGEGWKAFIHPDDLVANLPGYLEAFAERLPVHLEYRLRRRDGVYRWMYDIGTPRYTADGVFAGYIGSAIDITDRKEAEAQREAALRENARLLQIAAESAEQQQRFLRDVLYSVTEGKLNFCTAVGELPAPLPALSGVEPLALSSATLTLLRRQVDAVASSIGLSPERRNDLVVAVGEAAMNAVVHAGGGQARVRAGAELQRVQVWIEDAGKGIDLEQLPRATLERGYSSGGSLGHGFWMMLRTCDRIWLLTGPAGTTVVLEQEATEPQIDLF